MADSNSSIQSGASSRWSLGGFGLRPRGGDNDPQLRQQRRRRASAAAAAAAASSGQGSRRFRWGFGRPRSAGRGTRSDTLSVEDFYGGTDNDSSSHYSSHHNHPPKPTTMAAAAGAASTNSNRSIATTTMKKRWLVKPLSLVGNNGGKPKSIAAAFAQDNTPVEEIVVDEDYPKPPPPVVVTPHGRRILVEENQQPAPSGLVGSSKHEEAAQPSASPSDNNNNNNNNFLRIAVEGCAHGELETVYERLQREEMRTNQPIDLLVCCGDFQCLRNLADFHSLSVDPPHQTLGSFYKYYSGAAVAPYLTVFIGGTAEANQPLQELYYGGWVAPRIYYLGAAGVIRYQGVRIGGLSGVYKAYDHHRPRYERPPYDSSALRTVVHYRDLEIYRLQCLAQRANRPRTIVRTSKEDRFTPRSKYGLQQQSATFLASPAPPDVTVGGGLDVLITHDWPQGVERHGDKVSLVRRKPKFRGEIARQQLGSPPLAELLDKLRPRYWFAAHLHTKFRATVTHEPLTDWPVLPEDNNNVVVFSNDVNNHNTQSTDAAMTTTTTTTTSTSGLVAEEESLGLPTIAEQPTFTTEQTTPTSVEPASSPIDTPAMMETAPAKVPATKPTTEAAAAEPETTAGNNAGDDAKPADTKKPTQSPEQQPSDSNKQQSADDDVAPGHHSNERAGPLHRPARSPFIILEVREKLKGHQRKSAPMLGPTRERARSIVKGRSAPMLSPRPPPPRDDDDDEDEDEEEEEEEETEAERARQQLRSSLQRDEHPIGFEGCLGSHDGGGSLHRPSHYSSEQELQASSDTFPEDERPAMQPSYSTEEEDGMRESSNTFPSDGSKMRESSDTFPSVDESSPSPRRDDKFRDSENTFVKSWKPPRKHEKFRDSENTFVKSWKPSGLRQWSSASERDEYLSGRGGNLSEATFTISEGDGEGEGEDSMYTSEETLYLSESSIPYYGERSSVAGGRSVEPTKSSLSKETSLTRIVEVEHSEMFDVSENDGVAAETPVEVKPATPEPSPSAPPASPAPSSPPTAPPSASEATVPAPTPVAPPSTSALTPTPAPVPTLPSLAVPAPPSVQSPPAPPLLPPVDSIPQKTEFVALDKCAPRREYLSILQIPLEQSRDPDAKLEYDLEWLTILCKTHHVRNHQGHRIGGGMFSTPIPSEPLTVTLEDVNEVRQKMRRTTLEIPENFVATVPPLRPSHDVLIDPDEDRLPNYRDLPEPLPAMGNPQTDYFLNLLGLLHNTNITVPYHSGTSTAVSLSQPSFEHKDIENLTMLPNEASDIAEVDELDEINSNEVNVNED